MKKRLRGILSVLLAALCVSGLPSPVSAAGEGRPVSAEDVRNGTYEIEAETLNSSMFRIVGCTLTVTDEAMTARVTLSGRGFGKLYPGRGADAENEDESAFSPFGEDEEGRHVFDIPVSALDVPVPVAGWSIKRERWYDYDVVFRSDSLPDGAVTVSGGADPILWGAAALAAAAVAAAVFAAVRLKRKKKPDGTA